MGSKYKSIFYRPRFHAKKGIQSFDVTAIVTKTESNNCNSEMCEVSAVSSGRLNPHVRTSCCYAGTTVAPQTSGNGPDGAHPPITRSPMAQERGTCVNVLATSQPLVFGFIMCQE